MGYLHEFTRNKIVAMAICMLPFSLISSDEIQVESKLIFNTICAKCHEGECSRRLSYQLQDHAINQHILRHGGEPSLEVAAQLYELLRHMKEKCSYYPMYADITTDGILNKNILKKLKSPAGTAYFIPLGELIPGKYIIKIQGIDVNHISCIDIINYEFEFIDKTTRSDTDKDRTIYIGFSINEQAVIYFRITSQKPMHLQKLELLNSEKQDVKN